MEDEVDIGRRAFVHHLRTGRRLPLSAFAPTELKYNPYHDPRNGQFTFAPGGPRSLSNIRTVPRRARLPEPVVTENSVIRRANSPRLVVGRSNTGGRFGGLTPRQLRAAGNFDAGVYRPDGQAALLRQAQFRRVPPRGSGDNSRAFHDPMTLNEVFPGLRDAPDGTVLGLADHALVITAPATDLTSTMSRQHVKVLIEQIKAIDPSYRHDSFGAPASFEGQMIEIRELQLERARMFYRIRGETRPLQVETLRFLQQRTDAAYEEAVNELKGGKLDIRLSRNETIGNYVDQSVRRALRRLYQRLGISMERGQQVRVNNREYDTSGTDATYRRPDARVGDVAFDVTLATKTLATQQIRGFFNSDFQPNHVVIIRPSQLGAWSSYIINRPAGAKR